MALLLKRAGLNIQKLKGKWIFLIRSTRFLGMWILTLLLQVKKALNTDLQFVDLSRNPASFLKSHPEFKKHVEIIYTNFNHFQYCRWDARILIHMPMTNTAKTGAARPIKVQFESKHKEKFFISQVTRPAQKISEEIIDCYMYRPLWMKSSKKC